MDSKRSRKQQAQGTRCGANDTAGKMTKSRAAGEGFARTRVSFPTRNPSINSEQVEPQDRRTTVFTLAYNQSINLRYKE